MHRLVRTTLRVISYKVAFLAGVYVGVSLSNGHSESDRSNLLENRVNQLESRVDYLEREGRDYGK